MVSLQHACRAENFVLSMCGADLESPVGSALLGRNFCLRRERRLLQGGPQSLIPLVNRGATALGALARRRTTNAYASFATMDKRACETTASSIVKL